MRQKFNEESTISVHLTKSLIQKYSILAINKDISRRELLEIALEKYLRDNNE